MMNNKILIIGSHPIISDMTRQYSQRGDEVIHYVDDEGIDTTDLTAIREIVLLPDINKPSMEADIVLKVSDRRLKTVWRSIRSRLKTSGARRLP